MKISAKHDRTVSVVTVTAADNCDTDVSPMVGQVVVRQYQGSFDADAAALASGVLFARHCGALVEFEGAKLGLDAARAVRTIMPDTGNVLPIDGAKREIGRGLAAIVVGEASRVLGEGLALERVGRSARVVTWSGDFVSSKTRTSTQHVGGTMFTNARLVASGTEVSVAMALLVGGKGLRDIYVPEPPEDEAEDFSRLAKGLEYVSIKLSAI